MSGDPGRLFGSKRRYKGALSRPIFINPPPTKGILTDEDWYNKKRQEWFEESFSAFTTSFERLSLLFEHYGIKRDPETQWLMLAMALARDHVPGCRIVTKRIGRPKRNILVDICLFWRVQRDFEPGKPAKSETAIIRRLASTAPYSSLKAKSAAARSKTLERRYYEFKRGRPGEHATEQRDRMEATKFREYATAWCDAFEGILSKDFESVR